MSPLVAAYLVRSGSPFCAYAGASTGVGSLVGRELSQSLGHISWCQFCGGGGGTRNLDYILFYLHDNLANSFEVVFSTVICCSFYDVNSFSRVNIVFYVLI